ncbi:MAG: fibrobacter succinogenes major paralogous domain-containing protein [Bacteroidia bacterium]|nr:fibrobacter succinogenes major paralogous domain-containing protein [Bacteroidia bacterium]
MYKRNLSTDFPYDFTTTGWRGTDEGGKLKETGTTHWTSPNTGATNSSGFTGLPGGYRNYSDGTFNYSGSNGDWWSATEYSSTNAWIRNLYYSTATVNRFNYTKDFGFSVRCLKD